MYSRAERVLYKLIHYFPAVEHAFDGFWQPSEMLPKYSQIELRHTHIISEKILIIWFNGHHTIILNRKQFENEIEFLSPWKLQIHIYDFIFQNIISIGTGWVISCQFFINIYSTKHIIHRQLSYLCMTIYICLWYNAKCMLVRTEEQLIPIRFSNL